MLLVSFDWMLLEILGGFMKISVLEFWSGNSCCGDFLHLWHPKFSGKEGKLLFIYVSISFPLIQLILLLNFSSWFSFATLLMTRFFWSLPSLPKFCVITVYSFPPSNTYPRLSFVTFGAVCLCFRIHSDASLPDQALPSVWASSPHWHHPLREHSQIWAGAPEHPQVRVGCSSQMSSTGRISRGVLTEC